MRTDTKFIGAGEKTILSLITAITVIISIAIICIHFLKM